MIGAADRDRFVASTAGIEFWPTTGQRPLDLTERRRLVRTGLARPGTVGLETLTGLRSKSMFS
jgi:hypothetical protein